MDGGSCEEDMSHKTRKPRVRVKRYKTRTELIEEADIRRRKQMRQLGRVIHKETILVRGKWRGDLGRRWIVSYGLKGPTFGEFNTKEEAMELAKEKASLPAPIRRKSPYGRVITVVEDWEHEKYGW